MIHHVQKSDHIRAKLMCGDTIEGKFCEWKPCKFDPVAGGQSSRIKNRF